MGVSRVIFCVGMIRRRRRFIFLGNGERGIGRVVKVERYYREWVRVWVFSIRWVFWVWL